jgi:polyhydroxyalkanoate synthesis regulator phasin
MSVDEQGDMSPRMATSRRDTKQFADFVRIHALDGNLITRDDEMRILKEGVTRFAMDLEEARGILLRAAAEHNITLVSNAEHHVETMLEQLVKRGKIGRKEFEDVAAVYSKLTGNGVPSAEISRRVKQMVQEHGWRGRRTRRIFGSRKWFRKI